MTTITIRTQLSSVNGDLVLENGDLTFVIPHRSIAFDGGWDGSSES